MNCPNCGGAVPEGSAFCTNCGTPVMQQAPQMNQQQAPQMNQQQAPQMNQQMGYQPNQQMGYQPNQQMGYQQPGQQMGYQPNQQMGYQPNQQMGYQQQAPQKSGAAVDFGGMTSSVKNDYFKIASYVGIVLVFLSTFLPGWVRVSGFGMSDSAGLLASDGGVLKLWALLLLIADVIAFFYVSSDNINIPAINGILDKFKSLPYSQFYCQAFMLIIFLICTFNKTFRSFFDELKEYEAWGVKGGYGYAFWFCLIGIILLCVDPVKKLIKKEM